MGAVRWEIIEAHTSQPRMGLGTTSFQGEGAPHPGSTEALVSSSQRGGSGKWGGWGVGTIAIDCSGAVWAMPTSWGAG